MPIIQPKSPIRVIFLCLFSFFIITSAQAQQKTLSGNVRDESKNDPLAGVSITLKGTTTGTTTDSAGHFVLQVPVSKGVLVISNVGYKSKEIEFDKELTLDLSLSTNTSDLNEVVVVGYGTQKKRDITGAVVSVDRQRLEQMPNNNFIQALQGSVPGVSITQTSAGAEGNNSSIIVRGRSSITASNQPLIVLDGIPYPSGTSYINPVDVESVEVLKDASAAAIYGSRGANGVILVTTKKGSTGKPVITYDGSYGIQEIANLPPVMNPQQFYEFKQTREPGVITLSEQAIYDAGGGTDWIKLATQQGSRMQHNLSIRGGTKDIKYLVSGTHLDVKGVAINDKFQRSALRLNLDINVTPWLSFGTNNQITYINRDDLPANFSGDMGAYTMNPLTSPYQADGKTLTIYPWPEDIYFANPLAPLLASRESRNFKLFSNNYAVVRIPFIKGLSYRFNSGVEYSSAATNTYWGRNTKTGLQANGQLSRSNDINNNYLIENIVNYDKDFGKHHIDFTGLYSYQYDQIRTNTLSAEGFPDDVLTDFQSQVAQFIRPSQTYAKEILISQMGRVNYNYDGKYLLTLTARRDGFSGFGSGNKYSFFPVVAVGWNISEESFMASQRVVNTLKLRASYGSNGNQAVGPYQTLARFSERSYVNGTATAPGYLPTQLGYPTLGWETSTMLNVGLDFGLWNNRLQGTFDVYDKRTRDLLLNRDIPSVTGVGSILQNIGKTANWGMELGLTSVNVKTKNFSWNTNGNISFNRNRIVDLYGNGIDDLANKWFIGRPISVNYDLVFDGIWQEKDDLKRAPAGTLPGYAKIKDLNGDTAINAADRDFIGSLQPKFIWGLGNTFKYKNISLYIFAHGIQGVTRSNGLLSDGGVNAGVRKNTIIKNWWTPQNPTNEYWSNHVNANRQGVNIYEDASFIRIKDISLSYDFPQNLLKSAKLSRLRVYVDARNLVTITKWSGLDPELSDQTNIPLQKEYVIGLNIGL
jgi:TonB-linked SusC/RagA family outer membrane protein